MRGGGKQGHGGRKDSIAQVDYLRVHKEYIGIKAKLLEIHLENSKMILKNTRMRERLAF